MISDDDFEISIDDSYWDKRSKKDNLIVMLGILVVTVLLSNIIVYQIMNTKLIELVQKSEQVQYNRYSKLIQDEVLAAKTDMLQGRSEIIKQMDILESKYYFLEGLVADAERTGYLIIQK